MGKCENRPQRKRGKSLGESAGQEPENMDPKAPEAKKEGDTELWKETRRRDHECAQEMRRKGA